MYEERRDFDQEAAEWDNPGRVKMAKNIGAAIKKSVNLNGEMEVLDFGCGTGLLALELQPLVRLLTCVDSSAGMLHVLSGKIKERRLNNIHPLLLDVEKGDQLRGAYDLVISSMTLHHIQEIKPLLAQFRRILKPGGWLCIADLDPDQGHFHGANHNQGVFHFGFDRKLLGNDLEDAGFSQVEFRTGAEVMRFYPGGVKPFAIFVATARKA